MNEHCKGGRDRAVELLQQLRGAPGSIESLLARAQRELGALSARHGTYDRYGIITVSVALGSHALRVQGAMPTAR